jgi:hypothetical protein
MGEAKMRAANHGPYGVYFEACGRSGRSGGFLKDGRGLPRVFTREGAERQAAACRRRNRGYVGLSWEARPLPDYVLADLRQQGVAV